LTARIRQRGCGRFFFGGAMPEFEPYHSEAEIEEVVRRLESCEYAPEEFVHTKHLTVAAWYFLRLDAIVAEDHMRAGLQKFIRHHRKTGYHVTITEFWLRFVRHTLQKLRPGENFVSCVNQVIENLNDKNLIYQYYTRKRLEAPDAKASWIEPELKRTDWEE
jgi:hypothetical protein